MANLKLIRKRIASVKSTQKITRAMKMVAGARLNRAQQRILAMRPYAVRTGEALAAIAEAEAKLASDGARADHPLLVRREEKSALFLVVTSDRGLCGAFNSNINRMAERLWKERERAGQSVKIAVIGRKGRDYFKRRGAPVFHVFSGVWDKLDLEQSRAVARTVLRPYINGEVDAIYIIYNEFKSAMSQRVVSEKLFPVEQNGASEADKTDTSAEPKSEPQFIFEPNKEALLEQLVPMYVEISILRALYESMASELGARMTAMDSATKNASEMIGKLTLQYNRARQAAITTELMEIIGGAEALKD
ncbi:MAG TPA: ATP synthase F1 subunit gamma [Polyangiaceae bacterium]|nr:ATP synthase F1 subunit gamma [Polyangiaceae bacterium]